MAFLKIPIVAFIVMLSAVNTCEEKKANSTSNYGTLRGKIGLFEGNCMPGPDAKPCEAIPLATTVYITHPSEHYNPDLLVDSITSSPEGSFEMQLKKGHYSLFIRDGNNIVCDAWDCPRECYCTYFTIQTDSITHLKANVDHAVW